MSRKTVFDKIFDYYNHAHEGQTMEEFGLTATEIRAFERWNFIDNQYRRHKPSIRTKSIQRMVCREFSISERQFYLDLKNTDRLFGTLNERSKTYKRELRADWLEALAAKAERDGDYDAAVKALKEANRLEGLYTHEDNNSKDFIPHTYQLPAVIIDANGSITQTTFSLDDLNKLPKEQYLEILKAARSSRPSPDDMEKMIEEETGGRG